MAEPFVAAGADYLEQLLRAAILAPTASTDPSSGRVVARLMVALGAKREDERLEPYLSCWPGRPSVYEVTSYDDAGRPASRVSDLAAGQAIRAAIGFAAARPDCSAVVDARDPSGYERCVLEARGPHATYHFADVAPPSPPAQEARFSPPAQEATSSPPAQEATSSPPAQEAESARPYAGPVKAAPVDPRDDEQWSALATRLDALPTTDEVVDALHAAITGMTTELRERLRSLSTTDEQWAALSARLDALPTTNEVVDALHAAITGMTTDFQGRLSSLSTTDEVVNAIRELLAGMTIELDATAIEDVIHAALDEMPHADVAAIQARSFAESAGAEGPAAAAVTDVVEGGSAPPAAETATLAPAPVSSSVSINAAWVADQVSERPPEPMRTRYRGSVRPAAVGSRDANRRPSDRAVDDAPVLVALASRR